MIYQLLTRQYLDAVNGVRLWMCREMGMCYRVIVAQRDDSGAIPIFVPAG